MLRLLSKFIRFAFWFRLVLRRSGTSYHQYHLLPTLAVVPVVVYACVTQAIMTARSEAHERKLVDGAACAVARRLAQVQQADLATCRDYAYWDDTYRIVLAPDRRWIETNLDGGLGCSFGFDIALLQDAAGRVVWQVGLSPARIRALRRYGLLRGCLRRRSATGLVAIGEQIYTCAAVPVHLASAKGLPRGMVLVGRLVDGHLLADLAPGPGDEVALVGPRATVFSAGSSPLVRRIRLLPKRTAPSSRSEVGVSPDGLLSYGMLPVSDTAGNRIGSLAVIVSRADMVASLRTIRHMSISLVVVCCLVGLAGASYLRNRALALRANRDELTGLHNHGHFQDRLGDLIGLARRYSRPVALMMVDIDHFKFVNDSHGHASGDRVLRSLAEVMVATFRATDIVARYGGEEFVVALPETDLAEALVVAERLRQAVQGVRVHSKSANDGHAAGTVIAFTISVGVAAFPDDAVGPPDLIMAADAALGEAKRTRNCVFAYRHILKDRKDDRNRLETLDSFFRDSSISTIRPLVAAIDTRKPGSANHSDKTAEYAVAIGRQMGLSTQDLALVCRAALLHDIGEVGIPDQYLTKTGRLSEEELNIIKGHCTMGAQILSQSPSLASAAEIVLCHHERYDGQGYPNGLSGNEIPLLSHIVALADSLDAMTSARSYQNTRSMAQALEELRSQSGKQFDPRVVEAAEQVIRRAIEQAENRKAA